MSQLPPVQEWLDSFHSSDAKVWVEDPESNTEKVAGGFLTKQFFTYRILLKSLGRDILGVRHRFSEFETMRTELKNRYGQYGILVPSMPPKRLLVDDSFIVERTQGLTLFCQDIVSSPWLRNDSEWIEFMRAASMDIETSSVNMGEAMLLSAFTQLEPPANPYQRMCEFKDEMLLVDRRLAAMVESAKAMQACMAALDASNANMHQSLMEWTDAEQNCSKLSGEVYGSVSQNILVNSTRCGYSAAAYSNFMQKYNAATADVSLYTGVLMITALEHEIARNDSLRELFKAHDEITAAIDSLALKEQKLRSKDSKNQLPIVGKELADKRQALAVFFKGVIHFTLPMVVRQRAIAVKNFTSNMAAMQLVISNNTRNAANQYFIDIKASPFVACTKASEALDLLKVAPIRYPGTENGGDESTCANIDLALPQQIYSSQAQPAAPAATLELFSEAVGRNAKGSLFSGPGSHNVIAASAVINNDPPPPPAPVIAPIAAHVPVPVRNESPNSYQNPPPQPIRRSTSPQPQPDTGNRGSAPSLLGRGRQHNSPPPSEPALMEEARASPSPPRRQATPPVPEPTVSVTKPKPPSAKAKSLLDDLIGGDSSTNKPADDLWG